MQCVKGPRVEGLGRVQRTDRKFASRMSFVTVKLVSCDHSPVITSDTSAMLHSFDYWNCKYFGIKVTAEEEPKKKSKTSRPKSQRTQSLPPLQRNPAIQLASLVSLMLTSMFYCCFDSHEISFLIFVRHMLTNQK